MEGFEAWGIDFLGFGGLGLSSFLFRSCTTAATNGAKRDWPTQDANEVGTSCERPKHACP